MYMYICIYELLTSHAAPSLHPLAAAHRAAALAALDAAVRAAGGAVRLDCAAMTPGHATRGPILIIFVYTYTYLYLHT